MKSRFILLVLSSIFSLMAWSAPAPWFRWRSPDAERDICSQIAPGDGWVKVKGPYEDARCTKSGTPTNNWK